MPVGALDLQASFTGKWFQGKWRAELGTSRSIAWLELFPIVVALVLWCHLLKGKRIVLRSDNDTVVKVLNKQSSKCPRIMKLVRFLVLQCLKYNVLFCARHIPGTNNNIADALSRFQMERFRKAAPQADSTGTPIPEFVWVI